VHGAPAANLHHDPQLVPALHHIGVLEAVQAARVLEGGARGDGGDTVAGELVGVARENNALENGGLGGGNMPSAVQRPAGMGLVCRSSMQTKLPPCNYMN
jgi:hypothetical protein